MALDKRYDFKKVEDGKYENWKNKGYFTAGDTTKQKFSMVIPPPNVTGKLHIGHTLDTTIQDITCRYKKAKGFDVLYLPGCDHAGIATQAKVDKRLQENGVSRFDIGREEFLKQAFAWKDEYSEIIHQQWAKTGLMLDYSRERFTLDDGFSKAVYEVFVKLYNEGLIYRGEKIVNYDPKMKTALSNIEVIYKDDKGSFYYFKYRLVDDNKNFLIVATTRPETMFGDVCLCVNPKDKRYLKYIGKMVINPANGEKIPVIADDYVDISFGTGVMKCTPAHEECVHINLTKRGIQFLVLGADDRDHEIPDQPVLLHHGIEADLLGYRRGLIHDSRSQLIVSKSIQPFQACQSHLPDGLLCRILK